jgi:predicted DNA-binding transcriptional regulator AlpA
MWQHVICGKAAMVSTRPETTGRKPRDGNAARELNSGERLLTPKDAANFLRLSTSWLAKARMRGDGPTFVKLGRSVRYGEAALVQWLKSRARLSTSDR